MPGKLIHTNEILVLLGDNWFAEMSAKQSCEVIDRRLTSEYSRKLELFALVTFLANVSLHDMVKLALSRIDLSCRVFIRGQSLLFLNLSNIT